ncbi:MAG TPA: T9SS type A sorting domain-containing protein [Bacteroidia bacterium]|nr:T9SS type A sorting domain-containing protein [Bacteroidia bacterium]
MKKIITFIFALLIVDFSNAQAPDSWTEKNAIGLNVPSGSFMQPRVEAVGFSIGGYGYIGTGKDATYLKDFWEYNPSTNIWTQKADFGGTARSRAVGFSINSKGYIGTGSDGNNRNDFWEYDPVTNTWTQKANLGGVIRQLAVGFSIGSKGYIGTGYSGVTGTSLNDFWEYNPATDGWTQKANLSGVSRHSATGFSIGSYGFIGPGLESDTSLAADMWMYDPATNNWTLKASFSAIQRFAESSFSIGNKGYIACGIVNNSFWEYDLASNSWTQKASFTTISRYSAASFSIGNKGYIGTGEPYYNPHRDLWEYDPVANTWTLKTNIPVTTERFAAVGFSIGNSGFIGTGSKATGLYNDFWEYMPGVDAWTQKANFGGGLRRHAAGFSICNKGYIGLGDSTLSGSKLKNDLWEYDPSTNTWTQKANFGGTARYWAVGFNIGNKGYIGTGSTVGTVYNDFWEYNPVNNAWTQKANFGGTARASAVGFNIGNRGYIGTGTGGGGVYKKDFWEYNPGTNTWLQKADFGGPSRYGAVGFSVGNKGYIGTGTGLYIYKDLWEYDPSVNIWTQKTDFGGTIRSDATCFSIGGKGFIGTGKGGSFKNDLWEYIPVCYPPVSTIYSSGNTSFCNGDSVFFYVNNGYNYQWKKNGVDITGATSYFYYAKATGNYTCYLTNSCGTVASSAISVTVNSLPSATITPAGPTTFCSGGSVVLNVPAGANKTYQWKKGANLISGATLSSYTATTGGNYRVIVTNTVTGCSKTSGSATAVTVNTLPAATITPQGPTTFCAGGSVVLQANSGAGLTYKWKKGSNFISGATLSNYTATTGGNYRVQVTNSNGCSRVSALVAVSVPCKKGENILSENNFDVKVFPNPSSGDFVFQILNAANEKKSIDIYDMIGNLVLSKTVPNSEFTIHDFQLSDGIYAAVIMNEKNKKILKLIKTN